MRIESTRKYSVHEAHTNCRLGSLCSISAQRWICTQDIGYKNRWYASFDMLDRRVRKRYPKKYCLSKKFPAPNLPFGGCSGSTLQQRKMRKMMKLWMKPALLANLKPLQKAGLHAPGDILLRSSVVTQVSRKGLVRLKF